MVDTETSAETLKAYRSHHVIDLREEGTYPDRIYRCGVDGIRVLPTRNGRWRHHPDDILALLEAEYGGPWGGPKAIVVESNDAYEVTVDEDDEWTNREGMPEFNGSFR